MNAHRAERGAEHEAQGCTLALPFAVQLLQLQEDYGGSGVPAKMSMAPQFAAWVLTLHAIYPKICRLICRNAE